jgi:hypothetical protein
MSSSELSQFFIPVIESLILEYCGKRETAIREMLLHENIVDLDALAQEGEFLVTTKHRRLQMTIQDDAIKTNEISHEWLRPPKEWTLQGKTVIRYREGKRWKYPIDLACPISIVPLPNHQLAISDRDDHRIHIMSYTKDGLIPVRHFGSFGFGNNCLDRPMGMALLENEGLKEKWELAVADCGNHRVQIFSLKGEYRRTMGSYGLEKGQFISPECIVSAGKYIAVAMSNSCRLSIFKSTIL